jgi:hypothetical protein
MMAQDKNKPGRKFKPKIMAVRLNETDYWTGDIGDDVKFIHAHYLYDETVHTHICSIVPHYDLRFVGFDFEPSREMSDEEISNLWARISDEYSREVQDDYHHVARIDKIHEGNRRLWEEADDSTDEDLLEGDAFLEQAVDDYPGNPLW